MGRSSIVKQKLWLPCFQVILSFIVSMFSSPNGFERPDLGRLPIVDMTKNMTSILGFRSRD